MSGHGDSIRERRARESWENGWEEETTETKVTAATIGSLAAMIFLHPEEAAGFIENFLEKKKLNFEYLSWNGRTNIRFAGVY